MERVELGSGGLQTSVLGLGCMGMSTFYGESDDAQSQATIRRALDLGIALFDSADFYGGGHNERLLGAALAGRRGEAVVSLKFGYAVRPSGSLGEPNGRPEYARAACEASLRRLGGESIDLYTPARVDPAVPIEETVGGIARLVEEGKVRCVGLSEVEAETIRRAHAEHPISAVQNEYSLFAREPEREVLALCRELGIGFVAYSPLGRGILGGAIRDPAELSETDIRPGMPWYRPENFETNLELLDALGALAASRGVSEAQLAIAWVLAQGVVAIPGCRSPARVDENAAAAALQLSGDELAEIEAALPAERVAGERR